jgi:hypothetical protein
VTTMAGFRCWEAGSVRQTVYSDIGALPGDAEAVFLAAHTPMSLSHQRGEEVVDGSGGERDVLKALEAGMGDENRNTLIAVTGDSGAGKSHVVRWVKAHLSPNEDRFHVLYVPRAIQTIRELLRQIVDGLPGEHGEELMARIDAAVGKTSPAELQDRLLEEMRFALTWTLEPKQAREGETTDEQNTRIDRNNLLGEPDDQGKRRHGLADLLNIVPVNQALLRPGGTLDGIVKSMYAETSRRDEQRNRFERDDLPLRQAGVRSALHGNEDLVELWDVVGMDPDLALDVLNEAVQEALLNALGLRAAHGETLDVLFRQARQTLRQEGKELVLLFEDLAQFGLIDGELYDQFATQPGTDMAPLRVVFAVTDEPFARIVQTVGSRITHRFVVSADALSDRSKFIARYLNLVRLGRDRVESAWSRARGGDEENWVKNACDSNAHGLPCEMRSRCHKEFGAVEVSGLGAVGLYPYNEVAMRRALTRPSTVPITPRSDLDECVSATLNEAHAHLGRGTYPHERTFERFNSDVHQPKGAVLEGRSGEGAERLYRALVLWGDEQPLAPAVIEAFKLGDVLEVAVNADESDTKITRAAPKQSSATGGTARQDPPSNRPVRRPQRDSPLPRLFQWQNGEPLRDRDFKFYRVTLHGMVKARLDLDQDLIHTSSGTAEELLSSFFNQTCFDFGQEAYGRVAGADRIRFSLDRNAEDVKVLAAATWYADHGHWDLERAEWPLPPGYDPVDLMISLENRLDEWAEAVRKGFMARRNVRRLARAAVSSRAIALVCTGTAVEDVLTVYDTLSPTPAGVEATSSWMAVDQEARALLTKSSILELIGELAAVRQGVGAPQLIDITMLEADLRPALDEPTAYLQGVVDEFQTIAPILAESAKRLLAMIKQSGGAMASDAEAAVAYLSETLDGGKLTAVAKAANELGRRAVISGLFRPEDGVAEYEKAVGVLDDIAVDLSLDWKLEVADSSTDEAVRIQHWARSAVVAAAALQVVRETIALTQAESLRNTPESGDLEEREQRVRDKLDAVRHGIQALSGRETAGA